jgi:enoyl-CoA hydratase
MLPPVGRRRAGVHPILLNIVVIEMVEVHVSDIVLREQRGGVLLLTLNRPDQMNALSTDLVSGLGAALADAVVDPTVKVVHVTGAGPAFCAGADLIEARTVTQSAADFRAWLLLWRRTFDAIDRCPKPVVALLNGMTLAGGLELALACDYMVAQRSAKVGDVHANYGLVPGGGGSQRLPEAVGSRFARWLMFTGEILPADQAHAIGLVQQVFDDETFIDDCWAMGARMATRSQPGLAFMKRLSRPRITAAGIELEIEGAAHLITSEDAREGLAAFQEKRRPEFTAVLDDLG